MQNYWFADQNTPDDDDDYNPPWVWQPFLQMEGHVTRVAVWFRSEEECVSFIQEELVGAPFKP
jgi:hypothetical protein